MRYFLAILLFVAISVATEIDSKTASDLSALEYSFIKKGEADDNTVLVIGGIQGDEPGGFLAASLLATEYKIKKGSLWVVPNLNFASIIKRNRGIYGDMNRKFANIKDSDPDAKSVQGIKELITDKSVAMIVHLHDGSGFWRPTHINNMLNPNRWGNIAIIDQSHLSGAKYGELELNAQKVVDKINQNLLKPLHKYHIKNTHTSDGDKEMLKSLTYFAITQNKAAFANEASKTLPSHERVYYHLLAVEEYLRLAGIEFERGFELTPEMIKERIEKEVEIVLFNNRFFLSLHDPRAKIGFVPIPRDTALEYSASNPLTALVQDKSGITVHYGNRTLTRLIPQYFTYSSLASSAEIQIDENEAKQINFGEKIGVKNSFLVLPKEGARANIIGYAGLKEDESGIKISKNQFDKRYSIDKAGRIFRVELYEIGEAQDKFIGMFLVEFE